MTITAADAQKIDKALIENQDVQLGTELYNMSVGVGFTLPTSDPSVAGALWSDAGTVKVSAG